MSSSKFEPNDDILDFVIKKANGLKGLVDTNLEIIPNQCIQPKEQRLDMSQIDNQESIPTIDLSNFDDLNVEKSIQEAASKWGFFQIINHGIPIEVLEDLKDAAHKFFELPTEEKVKYHKEKLSRGESVFMFWSAIGEKDEKVLEWRDSIKHGCNPQNDSNLWPPQTRNQVLEYQKWAKPLAKKLLEVLLKGLNVNEIDESLEPLLMGTMSININYYPPCPNPSIAIGFRRHCDMGCITLLLQDDTGGLYIRGTKGNWIHVNPIKGALAVNIGDSLQIMSNDRYKSIEHCVAVDSSKARISVPLCVNPSFDSVIGSFPQMLKDGENPVYKHILFSDYWDHCFIKRPSGAKISDFGDSRLVSLDQTQVTTLVQGTLGYLDPEYFHTSQLTEKSDVYSFGVVLEELLTARMPLDTTAFEQERNLAAFFVRSIKENRLFQVLESRVLREGSFEQCQGVAELAKRCLRLTSEERPTMKEVAMELEGLRKFTKHPWSKTQQCQDEESLGLITEQTLDLYAINMNTNFMSNGEFSGQQSLDSRMMLQIHSPR